MYRAVARAAFPLVVAYMASPEGRSRYLDHYAVHLWFMWVYYRFVRFRDDPEIPAGDEWRVSGAGLQEGFYGPTDDRHSVAKPLTNLKPAVSAISETGGFNPVKPAVSVSETTGKKCGKLGSRPKKASDTGVTITYDILYRL